MTDLSLLEASACSFLLLFSLVRSKESDEPVVFLGLFWVASIWIAWGYGCWPQGTLLFLSRGKAFELHKIIAFHPWYLRYLWLWPRVVWVVKWCQHLSRIYITHSSCNQYLSRLVGWQSSVCLRPATMGSVRVYIVFVRFLQFLLIFLFAKSLVLGYPCISTAIIRCLLPATSFSPSSHWSFWATPKHLIHLEKTQIRSRSTQNVFLTMSRLFKWCPKHELQLS